MKVFKFGGASVKDGEAVRNLARIVRGFNEPMIVVISAMGKTTNALEDLAMEYFAGGNQLNEVFERIRKYHYEMAEKLFHSEHDVFENIGNLFGQIEQKLKIPPSMNYNYEYDQIVPYGELISTTIVSEFLEYESCQTRWIDIRNNLKTDENYREANVDYELSSKLCRQTFKPIQCIKYITQGFIGSSQNNIGTTLGREGSDYTAALLAAFVNGESVTYWKDVPGILNADPKWFDNTIKLDKLTYTDAIELSFYGASVLHPKTIQPVRQNNIPVYVKSFYNPELEGTSIGNFEYDMLIPSFIFKIDQVLIDIQPVNFSFIAEYNLEKIFKILAKNQVKVNLMQNTAVSFRICISNEPSKIEDIVSELEKFYRLNIEKNLELITIRYYDNETIDRVLIDKKVVLEQHYQRTIQMVVRKK